MDLTGWNGHTEWADILHVLWIGVARDVTGTLLMEVAECASFESTSYDGRLWDLHGQCVSWCRSHGIRPSTVEEWRALADFFFFFFGALQKGAQQVQSDLCNVLYSFYH